MAQLLYNVHTLLSCLAELHLLLRVSCHVSHPHLALNARQQVVDHCHGHGLGECSWGPHISHWMTQLPDLADWELRQSRRFWFLTFLQAKLL